MRARRGFAKGFDGPGGRDGPCGHRGRSEAGGSGFVRSVPGERFSVNSEGLIEGHVIVFNQRTKIEDWLGTFWEELAPGSAARTISDPHNDIRALKNHDSNWVLGRQGNGMVDLREDDMGVLASIRPPKTTWADDLRVSIQRGDVPGASFRFWPMKTETTVLEDGLDLDRHIDMNVSEVSVGVPWPAYEGTSIDARSRGLFPPSFRGLFGSLSAAVREGDGAEFDRCVGLLREMVIQKVKTEETTVWGFEEDPESQLAALDLFTQV